VNELALARLLPVAPRPETDERLSSWLVRIAALYAMPVGALLAHCGLVGADPFALEKGLAAGEGVLLAERTGLSPEAIEAMTFRELAAPARSLIARRDRGICPLCANSPAIRRRDAALPWGFWCAVHRLRRRPLAGEAIETLFGAAALTALDPLARQGARRLGDWAAGRDDAGSSVPDLLAFATAPHRRPSPPQLHEQPRLSLEARRAYRGFLEFPIVRQALLVVVPEYDRIAPPLVKPVRAGLQGLADGSLLQNFALAVAVARLTLAPVDYAAAALAACDEEGVERLRATLEAWPTGLRRRVLARFRALVAEKENVRARATAPKRDARRPVSRTPARVSSIPIRLVSRTPTRNLTNPAPNRGPAC
jgi:hypothetical protein